MAEAQDTAEGVFEVPDFKLACGATLRPARLVWKAYGDASLPVCLHPTSFGARHADVEYNIGPGKALDTCRVRVIVPNMLCNGLSTSPSLVGKALPLISVADNVRLQKALLDSLGVTKLALVYGWSMGATQAIHWAVMYPSFVERVLASCGTASCGALNAVFLDGLAAVLTRCDAFSAHGGFFPVQPTAALDAFGHVDAGWCLSDEFFESEMWRSLGCSSVEEFLKNYCSAWATERDANDFLAQIATWRHSDVTHAAAAVGDAVGAGSRVSALGRVSARVLVCASGGECIFSLRQARAEAAAMGPPERVEVVLLSEAYGHFSGNPWMAGQEADAAALRAAVARLLDHWA